jgi:hypothetical protein
MIKWTTAALEAAMEAFGHAPEEDTVLDALVCALDAAVKAQWPKKDALETAIALIRCNARAEALEEAANLANYWVVSISDGTYSARELEEIANTVGPEIAAAIRARKDKQ